MEALKTLVRATALVALVVAGAVTTPVTALAQGSIIVENRFPTQNKSVRLNIIDDIGAPVDGARVKVTYRPGSSVSRDAEIGVTSSGTLQWTPEDAGIASITATWPVDGEDVSVSENVSVRFSSTPITGVVIMVVAGIVLMLGSIVRILRILQTPDYT